MRLHLTLLGMLILSLANTAGAAPSKSVPPPVLPSLRLGPDELPWSLILARKTSGSGVTSLRFEALSNSPATEERWAGNPRPRGGPLKRELHSIVAVAGTAGKAVSVASKDINSSSMSMPEKTGDTRVASFTDRAWFTVTRSSADKCISASLVFVRGNVVASLTMTDMDGFPETVFFQTASQLAKRIDAAAAGKPLPAPVLPPSVEEMRCSQKDAWDAYMAGKEAGKNGATLIVKNDKGEPRAVPAYLDNGSYMVPLRFLVAAVNPRTLVEVDRVETRLTWGGKALTFPKGGKGALVNGKAAPLRKPVVVKRGQIMVPLSFVESALGRPITWTTHQGQKMARF